MIPEERAALPSIYTADLVDEEKAAIARYAEITLEIAYNAQTMVDMARGGGPFFRDIVEAAAEIYKLAEECQRLWFKTWGAGDAPELDENHALKGYDRPFMYREFGEREG